MLCRRTQLLPRVAAVSRYVEAASRTAARQVPGSSPSLPQSCEENGRVGRVEANIGCAGVVVFVKHLLPGLTSVGRAVHATFAVRTKRMSQNSGESNVRIGWMNDHRPDLPFLFPDVLPGLSSVNRLINAVADHHVAANVGFTRANVDHVGIRRGDRNRAGRARLFI